MAWGLNDFGQLGNGVTNTTGCKCVTTPGAVSGLTNVIAASAGANHSLALKDDGTVWAWGHNSDAQLGDGTSTNRSTPVRVGVGVTGFSDIIAIDAGGRHNLALKSDGTVWAWGDNNSGQIGNGTLTDLVLVVQITSLSNNILAISAGTAHSMALSKTGQVYVWGQNDAGQLGNGTSSGYAVTPTLNTNISGVAQIQAAGFHNVALKTDGTVWAWGVNFAGQIGNGTAASISGCQCMPTPTQSSITGVIAIRSETGGHTLARKKDGTIWAWGHNSSGQIGNGTTNTGIQSGVLTPVQSSVGSGNVIFGTGLHHSLLSVPTIPTPAGTNVVIRLGDGGYIRFSRVAFDRATTTIAAIDPNSTGLSVPAGLTVAANHQAYNISSTYVGETGRSVFVCLNAANEFDETEFNKLRLLHGEGSRLVDRTVSRNYQKREICAGVTTLSPFVLAKENVTTAAQVSVSGKVLTAKNAGLRNAHVSLTDASGNTRSVMTGAAGVYRFDQVNAGETYVLQVTSKRYLFTPQAVNVTEEISNLDFRARF